jgi:hypothetical protein
VLKNAVIYILIAATLTSLVGYFPVFKIEQLSIRARVKRSIKEGIPESELHIIEFQHPDQIDWTRVDKEFKIGERFFDIVRVDPTNKLKFSCVNDVEETILFAHLDENVNRQLEDNQPLQRTGKVFVHQLHFYENHNVNSIDIALFYERREKPFDTIQKRRYELTQRIPSPPPQV